MERAQARAIGQHARRGEGERFQNRVRAGTQVGAVGGHQHGEGVRGGTRRGADTQAVVGRRGEFRELQIDLVGRAVQPGNEIVVGVRRRAAPGQQQIRVRGRGVADDQRQVRGAGVVGEGEVGRRAGRVGADKSLGSQVSREQAPGEKQEDADPKRIEFCVHNQ